VQSVAAFLSALLPEVVARGDAVAHRNSSSETGRIAIQYHPDEGDERMHGVGLRLSSHVVDTKKGESTFEGGCPRSVDLAKTEREAFVPADAVMKGLEEVFGEGVRGRFITDLADAALPAVCHNRPLPCADSGACMSLELLGQVMAEADRAFCGRYAGANGGRTATLLATYPFLQEIMATLIFAANGATDSYAGTVSKTKLTVFSGHDTVVAPVLAALSVYAGAELCRWPPYASRVAFELWQPKGELLRNVPAQSYVRVIFNGMDITDRIPACQRGPKREHCTLAQFTDQVNGMLGTSHQSACRRSKSSSSSSASSSSSVSSSSSNGKTTSTSEAEDAHENEKKERKVQEQEGDELSSSTTPSPKRRSRRKRASTL